MHEFYLRLMNDLQFPREFNTKTARASKEENDMIFFKIEDEILREKLVNINLLIDKIKALKLTPSIPFMLDYPSSSPIPVVDSDFLVEEIDTFLVPEDSIPPGIGTIDVSQNVEDDDLLIGGFAFVIPTFLRIVPTCGFSFILSTGS
ncbi:hypothetical protein Tco_0716811 [Tanacetum coccineum]